MRRAILLCGAVLLCARAHAEEPEHEPTTHERREALKAILGDAPPAARLEWMRIAAEERGRRRASADFASGSLEWVNFGPADATFEVNGVPISGVDSGRPTGVAVDPRDPEVVYLAGAGSGIWKTWNFLSGFPNPAWVPITDGASDLSVGALAMDPQNPDTLYAGLGDFDSNFHAAGVIKSVNGGASWSAPVMLSGAYPAGSGGLPSQPLNVRDLRVDPTDGTRLLAATEFGLYLSVNGGASFSLIDLPNSGAARSEALWSLAYVGSGASGSIWLATGVYACTAAAAPPWTGNNATCNLGDIWRSADSGATWASLRSAGKLPVVPDFGRVTVATGSTASAAQTVVYAFVANGDDSSGNGFTRGFWRSTDGGQNWADATGTLANPTLASNGTVSCADMNVGHDQSDYNQYVLVDPQNPDHVLVGGNLCGVRTLNGTAASPTWENVSHWLPLSGGTVAAGTLPYVHADWHAGAAVVVDGVTRVFAGTDGGLFSSANVFDPATLPAFVTWKDHNRGLASHLCYSVASGDPANGNPLTVFTGLQDNGTRFRDATASTSFSMRLGGDGIGAAVSKGTGGEFWWASVQHKHFFCPRSSVDCLDLASFNWSLKDPPATGPDTQPFIIDYAPVSTDPTGAAVLTNTARGVWKSDATQQWTKLFTAPGTQPITHVVASPTIPGLYGAVNGFGRVFMVTGDETTWRVSNQISVGGVKLWTSATSLDFPPVTPAGKQPGDVYAAASSAAVMENGTLVPASAGHLFLTQDRGTTFTPLHGNGTSDLPNVPVYVVRYDPADATGNTLYAGTLIGVYRTVDGGATWARFGTGLPHVAVTAMFIARNNSLLRVATWGRGLWEIYPDASSAGGVRGDGDYDRNLAIDFTDVAALAARMGTTPATPGWPTYSHYADLTGSANAIDDADLAALLGKLGDHP